MLADIENHVTAYTQRLRTASIRLELLPRMTILYDSFVIYRLDRQHLGIRYYGGSHKNRSCLYEYARVDDVGPEMVAMYDLHRLTNRTTTIQTLRHTPLGGSHLHGSCGYIVGCCVAKHIVQRVLFGNVTTSLAYYEAQLGFIVTCTILSTFRNVDGRRIWSNQSRAWLREEDWGLGDGKRGFL